MVQAKETAVGKLLEELISITREGKGNEWYKTMRSKSQVKAPPKFVSPIDAAKSKYSQD